MIKYPMQSMFYPLFMCFSPYLGVFFCRGGGGPKGAGAQPAMWFSSLCSSKMEISETEFFFTLTIHNDQIFYVKHVSHPIHVIFTLFGCLDGGKGVGHNLVMQFYSVSSSKMEIFKTDFFCFDRSK